MAYIVRYHEGRQGGEMLYEAKGAELRAALEGRHDQHVHGVRFQQIPAFRAHQWVRSGRPHATSLWLDGARIRRA